MLLYGDSNFSGYGFDVTGVIDPSPFSLVAGRYSQIINSTDYLSLSVSSSGAFTGTLYRQRIRITVKGKFDVSGNATSLTGVPHTLRLDREPNASGLGANVITGTVSDLAISAYRAAYKTGDSAPEAGLYTSTMTPQSPSSTVPPGIGYTRITITKTGNATVSGRLPDGSTVTYSGPLHGSSTGKKQLLLYTVQPYTGKGMLSVPLTFDTTVASDCSGICRWIKPDIRSTTYPTQINTSLNVTASRYGARSRGLPALDFPSRADNVLIRLSGGGLTSDIVETATFSNLNAVTITGLNMSKLKVTINASTGTFSTTFIHPATRQTMTCLGVLYQNIAFPQSAGYFIGPLLNDTRSGGKITLLPN
jgi:hypothetical protein